MIKIFKVRNEICGIPESIMLEEYIEDLKELNVKYKKINLKFFGIILIIVKL